MKAEELIKRLLPLCCKKSGAALVCNYCGIVLPPHNPDCPVKLAEDFLFEVENEN